MSAAVLLHFLPPLPTACVDVMTVVESTGRLRADSTYYAHVITLVQAVFT